MAEKFRLSNLKLDEISLVDRGANQRADVVLFKAVVEKAPAGVQFNIGFKEGGGSDIQSVIFNQKNWTKEQAKQWLDDHKMVSSKVDETANTLRYRQHDPSEYTRFRVIQPGAQMAKLVKSWDAGDSLTALQAAVSAAVQDKFKQDSNSGKYSWVRDLYLDCVIVDYDGQTLSVPYTVDEASDGKNVVMLGTPIPVEVSYDPAGADDDDITEKRNNVIPVELLFKLGRLQAGVALAHQRLDRLSK